MENTTMWLANERLHDARERARRDRMARTARTRLTQPSLLRRIRTGR